MIYVVVAVALVLAAITFVLTAIVVSIAVIALTAWLVIRALAKLAMRGHSHGTRRVV